MLPPDLTIHNRYRVNAVVDDRPGSKVFRARDEQTGRFVLLAVLPAEGDQAHEDIGLAAGQIAAVRHDALLSLIDHFAEGEAYYLVCDDPGGQDMERALRARGGRLPEAEVFRHAVRLLGALDHLHSQRPPLYLGDPVLSDLWVGEDGAWRLLPFALARPIGHMPSPYRAPELAQDDGNLTPASDLYAVGALLYQILTGTPPTTAEQQAAGAPLIGPRSLNPALSALAEQAILRALQLRAVNRYQVAREMRLALETVQVMGDRSLGLGPDVLPAAAAAPPWPAAPAPPVIAPPALPADSGEIGEASTPPTERGIYPAAASLAQPASSTTPMPAPAQAPAAPARRRQFSTGCLVAIVVVLTLLVLGVCVTALLVILPFGPLHWLVSTRDGGPSPTAAAVGVTAAPATPAAPLPTAASVQLGARAITLQNAAQITQTREITSSVFGPAAYAPQGKLLAIGVDNVIKLADGGSLNEVRQISGHTSKIFALAWSPDSALLASSDTDESSVRLWDAATGKLVQSFEGHTGWVRNLAFSPDGKLLASSSVDMTIRLWEVASGKLVQTLKGHTDWVSGVAFSPDGASLVSTSRDGSVRLWDVAAGRERSGFAFKTALNPATNAPYWTNGVAFSPDGKILAVGSTDGIVRILDSVTGAEQRQLHGHTNWIVIRGVAFSPDGKVLASAGFDGTIRLWDPATGTSLGMMEGRRLPIQSISFTADGKEIASSSDEEGRISIWDVTTKQSVNSLRTGYGLAASLAFSSDSTILGVSGFNGVIALSSLRTQETNVPLVGSSLAAQQSLAFLAGSRLVAIGVDDQISIYSSEEPKPLNGLDGKPLSVTASRSGALIAAGSSTGAVVIWDAASGTARPALHSDLQLITRLAFNDDGSLLAVGGPSSDPRIEIWDTTAGTKRRTLEGAQGLIIALAFQPGSSLIAAADLEGALRIWNAQDGQLVQTISAQPEQVRFIAIAFSPDGSVLATGSLDGFVQFWNPTTGAGAGKINLSAVGISALAFSPDGQMLAAGGRDQTIRIFELPGR